jgi:hypothetical protein
MHPAFHRAAAALLLGLTLGCARPANPPEETSSTAPAIDGAPAAAAQVTLHVKGMV